MKNLIRKVVILVSVVLAQYVSAGEKPNIIIILCDDLGYGDIQCFNPDKGKIPTPWVDKLASQGMMFTDAHSSSSVCTPTRYSLLTGRYNWRTVKQRGVHPQYGGDPLIAADRPTIASFLRDAGYYTGIVGKWHLGYQVVADNFKKKKGHSTIPLGAKIKDGPISRGFDYFYGSPFALPLRPVILNDTVVSHHEEIETTPAFEEKGVAFIRECVKEKQQPFFLYLSLVSPHTPIVPSPEWQGKSGLPQGKEGDYGDFVMQTDGVVGSVMKTLDELDIAKNTMVIFTSDNGASKAAKLNRLEAAGHFASGKYRGSKADIWEGGHRVPFVVRWPLSPIKAGSVSDQLISLNDFFATFAEMLNKPVPGHSAEDSVSFLPALWGEQITSTRAGVVHHSISGHFAYRTDRWKLCLAKGSGGWSDPKEVAVPQDAPKAQLYDMEKDPYETNNLYEKNPEVAEYMLSLLEADVIRGRSTEGPEAKNDTSKIVLWKTVGRNNKESKENKKNK